MFRRSSTTPGRKLQDRRSIESRHDRNFRHHQSGHLGIQVRRQLGIQGTVEAALNVLEAVSIAISEPRLNLQRGRWGDATKYFQFLDREGGEDDEEEES